MSRYKDQPLSPAGLKTYPLRSRPSLVEVKQFGKPVEAHASLARFFDSLPDILAGADLKALVAAMARARKGKKGILYGLGPTSSRSG